MYTEYHVPNNEGNDGESEGDGKIQLRPDEEAFAAMLGTDEADLLLLMLLEEEGYALQQHKSKLAKKKVSEEDEKKLELIRYAFTLLRDEFGGIAEMAKINPLAVLSFTRAVYTNHIPAHSIKVAVTKAAMHHAELAREYHAILRQQNYELNAHKPRRPKP